MTEGTPVNSHDWLTHEAIMDAIKTDRDGSRLMAYSVEARTVGAESLASDLAEWALQRADIRSVSGPRALHNVEPADEPRVTVNYGGGAVREFALHDGELYGRYPRNQWPVWERCDRSGDVLDHEQRATIDALRTVLVAYANGSRHPLRPADRPMA